MGESDIDQIAMAWRSSDEEELLALLKTGNDWVAHAIASKGTLPAKVITGALRLVRSPTARAMIADNRSATRAHLKLAAKDKEPIVKQLAKFRLRREFTRP